MEVLRKCKTIFAAIVVATSMSLTNSSPLIANEKVNSADIDDTIRFRKEMGLEELEEPDFSSGEFKLSKFGAYLTVEEEQELDERINQQKDKIPFIKDFIEENLKEEFAGIYIDQRSGGVVNIGFKANAKTKVENHLEELRELYEEDKLIIYFTEYSEDELNEIADHVFQNAASLEKRGLPIVSVNVDLPTQKINIGVKEKPSAKKAAKLLMAEIDEKAARDEMGFDADIFNIKEEEVRKAQARPDDKFRPIQAGLEIKNDTENRTCTSAFSAQKNNNFYVITAGHCTDNVGDRFEQGGARFGRTADFNFGGSVDAAIIELTKGSDDATYYLFGNHKSNYSTITEVQRTRDETIGDTVCISGSQMGKVKCGTLESTNWRGSIVSPNGETQYFTNMRQATYSEISGDSGGPIFYGGTAIGVHSADTGVYTHISKIEDYFNLDAIFTEN
ncbi:S1 family peptidase [Brevibacillus brevis]|uniref:S1 family peptidase n=1 Tax=Brevibacillus brevis TaxID=1393 RepID=UPI0013E01AFB|nr:S1 family peptidase [Brevibacillus brevis]